MIRLLVHVEGQTEVEFVNQVLAPHLYDQGFSAISARLIGNIRQRSHRGGIRGWHSVRSDLVNHMNEDRSCFATTLVDYNGLPQKGEKAWPGRAQVSSMYCPNKAKFVQDCLADDIGIAMGKGFDSRRFIPFLMVHEFEALLFSDCARFSSAIGYPDLIEDLQQVRDTFESPEDINESPDLAPSKRIVAMCPNYQKTFHGILAALEIGLLRLRKECPHFSDWVSQLETLPAIR